MAFSISYFCLFRFVIYFRPRRETYMKKLLVVALVAGFVFCAVAEAKHSKKHKTTKKAAAPTQQTEPAPAPTTK